MKREVTTIHCLCEQNEDGTYAVVNPHYNPDAYPDDNSGGRPA